MMIAALILAASALSACGVRGPVEAPPGSEERDRDKPVLLDPLIIPKP
ncbi:lipoprotein [Rhodoligotrophos appendicifer]